MRNNVAVIANETSFSVSFRAGVWAWQQSGHSVPLLAYVAPRAGRLAYYGNVGQTTATVAFARERTRASRRVSSDAILYVCRMFAIRAEAIDP